MVDLAPGEWTETPASFDKARKVLDRYLNLTELEPWDYRKGVGYFLRGQSDYADVFQLAKFAKGRHREWKPFMAHLLGFDAKPIETKYDAEAQLAELEDAGSQLREILKLDSGEADRVRGAIQILKREVRLSEERIERFSFYEEERLLNEELVSDTESRIAEINERRYIIDYEVEKLEEAIESTDDFDLDRVAAVFEEAEAALPDSLVRSYSELIEFNRLITADRAHRFTQQLERLQAERELLLAELQALDRERSAALAMLRETDSFQKLRSLQSGLTERRTELARLEVELEQLDALGRLKRKMAAIRRRIEELVETTSEMISSGNELYDDVRLRFHEIVESVLNVSAILSISLNREGNLEFEASILKGGLGDVRTAEDRGFSYRRLLCIAFDLALLAAHSSGRFYRFVYHDGALESLDDRKKLQLIDVVSDFCERFDLQYIMTAIDSDLPRFPSGEVWMPPEEIIVRRLHDRGDEGQLFRMPSF